MPLLAAKLNIRSGASATAVASIIAGADAFLALHGSSSRSSLSQQHRDQVLEWMETLDACNNGHLGPGHCD